MKIGLYDVDSKGFPNLPLMKISAYHKAKGDEVEFITFLEHYDIVYVSKVFGDEYSQMSEFCINADKVIYGGTGFAVEIENGKEVYNKDKDTALPEEIEHIYPDYSIYPDLTQDTAFGFLTRGCPRGCKFCIVAEKEGRRSRKVADLSEFWRGQKRIELLDPNILACKDHLDLLGQLAESKARVNFNQGLDIRLTNEANISLINRIKIKEIHFAWDNPNDDLKPYFERYKALAKHNICCDVCHRCSCGLRQEWNSTRRAWINLNNIYHVVIIGDKLDVIETYDANLLTKADSVVDDSILNLLAHAECRIYAD